MKLDLSTCTLAICLNLVSVSLSAAVIAERTSDLRQVIACRKLAESAVIDGFLDEWDMSQAQILLDEESLRDWGHYNPPVDGDTDASARVAIAWDDKGILFAAEAVDDIVVGLPADPGEKIKNMWDYDGFMVLFYPTPGLLTDRSRYLDKPDGIDRMRQWGLNVYPPEGQPRRHAEQIEYVTRRTDKGYNVEARFPWQALGFSGRVGDRYRFNMIMPDADDDLGSRSTNWGQLIWGFASKPVHDQQRYAPELRLIDERGVGAELIPAHTAVQADRPLLFQLLVDTFTSGIRAESCGIVDADGTVLWKEKLNRNLAANQRTTFSLEVPVETLPPARELTLQARITAGDQAPEMITSTQLRSAGTEVVRQRATAEPRLGISASGDPSRYALRGADFVYSRKQWQDISREDYYRLAVELSSDPARLPLKKPEEVAAEANAWAYSYAIYALGRYVHEQEPRFLELSKALVHSTYMYEKEVAGSGAGGAVLSATDLWHWYFYLLDNDLWNAQDDSWFQELILLNARRFVALHGSFDKREYGAQNRAYYWAIALQGALYFHPDIPEADLWEPYVRDVWDEWWPYRDTDENSDAYSAAVIGWKLPDLGRLLGLDVYNDSGWQELAKRWLYEIAPSGARPSYGDGTTFNGSAIANLRLFEHLATISGDGHCKWTAHRLFEYAKENTLDWTTWHLVQDRTATDLFWAYLHADESVRPTPMPAKSLITTRKLAKALDATRRNEEKRWFEMLHEEVPNKLVLSSGNDRLSMWALVELAPTLGHSLGVAPNIACLMSNYAALLTDQSYMDQAPDFHNVLTVEDLEGLAATGAQERISVPILEETAAAVYAVIDIDLYRGYPVTHRRQIAFIKNQFMLVKDDIVFHESFLCRVGPRWHTRQIFPVVGRNWANTFIDFHLSTGLGMGSGLHRTENPNFDLLVWFLPNDDCRLTILDRTRTNIWQTLPQQLHYAWEGLPAAGEKLSFTTLLWPHRPDRNAQTWAENVTALVSEPDVAAVQVQVQPGLQYVVMFNDTGEPRHAGSLASDARMTLLIKRDSKPERLAVYDGMHAQWDSQPLLQMPNRRTSEQLVE